MLRHIVRVRHLTLSLSNDRVLANVRHPARKESQHLTDRVRVLFCLAIALMVVGFLTGCTARNAHTRQDPRRHIVLTREPLVTGGCGLQQSEFFQIFPDGQKATSPFRIPDRRLLIVTDVDWWLADFRPPSSPGFSTYFELALEHQTGALITTHRVFRDVGIKDPQDRLGRSISMTTGFVVSSGTRICPFAQVADTPDTDLLRLTVILRGYLMADSRKEDGVITHAPTAKTP